MPLLTKNRQADREAAAKAEKRKWRAAEVENLMRLKVSWADSVANDTARLSRSGGVFAGTAGTTLEEVRELAADGLVDAELAKRYAQVEANPPDTDHLVRAQHVEDAMGREVGWNLGWNGWVEPQSNAGAAFFMGTSTAPPPTANGTAETTPEEARKLMERGLVSEGLAATYLLKVGLK